MLIKRLMVVKKMKKNRTHKKPKFTKTSYKIAGVDIITPDDVAKSSASIAKERLLASIASTKNLDDNQSDTNQDTSKNTQETPTNAPTNKALHPQNDPIWQTDKQLADESIVGSDFALTNTADNQKINENQLVDNNMTTHQTDNTAQNKSNNTPTAAPTDLTDNDKTDNAAANDINSTSDDDMSDDETAHDKTPEHRPTSDKTDTVPPATPVGVNPVPYPKTYDKPKKVNWLPIIVIGLLAGFGLGFCASGFKQKPAVTTSNTQHSTPQNNTHSDNKTANTDDGVAKKTPVMAVEAVQPSNFVQTDSLSADGVIAGHKTAMVGAKATGLSVEEVFVDVGDKVKAGQVLAILDDKFAEQDVIAMTADKKQAEANLARVNSDFERIQSLMDIDAISWQQYDQYKAAKLQAEAQLEAINARLANTTRQEKNTKVVAPVSGVISERMAEIGMVTTGGALFGIVKTDKLEWRANIKAADRQKVSVGQTVRLKNGITGQVARISPTANAARDLTVFVPLNNAKNTPVGSYHTGEFVLASKSVLTVPAKVVMSYDGGDYVWTLSKVDDKTLADNGYTKKDDNLGVFVAKKQTLANAKRLGDKVATDLPKETLIVKSGGNFLSDGDWVVLTAIDQISQNDDLTDDNLTSNDTDKADLDNTVNDKNGE